MAGEDKPPVWLKVEKPYVDLVRKRRAALFPESEMPQEELQLLPEPLRQRFLAIRKRIAARFVASGEEDKDVIEQYERKGYAEVQIWQVDSGEAKTANPVAAAADPVAAAANPVAAAADPVAPPPAATDTVAAPGPDPRKRRHAEL